MVIHLFCVCVCSHIYTIAHGLVEYFSGYYGRDTNFSMMNSWSQAVGNQDFTTRDFTEFVPSSMVNDKDLAFVYLSLHTTAIPYIISSIKAREEEFGGPGSLDAQSTLADLEVLNKEALRRHWLISRHRVVTAVFMRQGVNLTPLARMPLARKALLAHVRAVCGVLVDEWDVIGDKPQPSSDVDPAPYEAECVGEPLPEDPAWYAEPALFDEATECKLPAHPKRVGENKGRNAFHAKKSGTIVFSSKAIERTADSDRGCADSFEMGKDSIFARCFWSHPVYALPIGVDAKGQPVYPSEALVPTELAGRGDDDLRLYMLLRISVNGKAVMPEFNAQKGPASFRSHSNDTSDVNNFFAFGQTCSARLLFTDQVTNPLDDWELGAQYLARALVTAGAGKHTVKVDLYYQLVPSLTTLQTGCAVPARIVVRPLATGTFSVTVPNKPVMARLFPVRNTELATSQAAAAEKAIKEAYAQSPEWGARRQKTEGVEFISLQGGWGVFTPEQHIEEWDDWNKRIIKKIIPTVYGIEIAALFSRTTATGWPVNHIAIFRVREREKGRVLRHGC